MTIDRPISIAVILFIVFLLVFFLAVPEYNTFKILQADLGEKKAEFNAKFDYYAAIDKTYSDLQSRSDDIKKIDDALPQNSSLGNLIYFVQKTAKENGMMVKNISLSKSSSSSSQNQPGNIINEMVFSANLLGDYMSLENFMISLEKSARLFEVTSISFSSAGVSSGSADASSQKSPQAQPQTQKTNSFNLQIKTQSY